MVNSFELLWNVILLIIFRSSERAYLVGSLLPNWTDRVDSFRLQDLFNQDMLAKGTDEREKMREVYNYPCGGTFIESRKQVVNHLQLVCDKCGMSQYTTVEDWEKTQDKFHNRIIEQ